MNRRIRRVAAGAAVALALPTALAGCGAGFEPATAQISPDYPGGDVGPVGVRSLVLIQPETGPAAAVVTLVNRSDEPQTLSSLQIAPPGTSSGSPSASPSMPLDAPASVSIPPHGAVHVGAQGQPTVTVMGLDRIAEPGKAVPVTLIFDKAGRITLTVVIKPATGFYASFAPTATPSPTTGTPAISSGSPSGVPSESPSPTPTETPSG